MPHDAPLVTSPITIFFIVLTIIVLAPVLLNRLRIPHIVGMIAAGVIVGPHGFNILADDSSFIIFGQVGLLYLMFLAGLEIDMYHLKLNFRKGMVFGILTFLVPMVMGIAVSYWFLNLDLLTSVLLASMFASHTLISYPVAARYGVTKSSAVLIAVVGTIFAVVGALLVLAGIININEEGEFLLSSTLWLIGKLIIYGVAVAILYPLLTRWFLKRYSDRVTQYVFILALVFLSAWIAKIIGLEGVLGAFLAGLVLNRYVPPASPLMSRVEFVGNAIFIPYFLIGVGMMVNLSLLANWETIMVAVIMLAVAFLSKWLAALISRLYYKMNVAEGQMLFGLTTAHTAVALAVVTIGYSTFLPDGSRMMDERILNGTILVILITCGAAPIITARASAKLRLRMLENDMMPGREADQGASNLPKREDTNLLVPVSNPVTSPSLMELAILLSGFNRPKSNPVIHTLHVRNDNSPKSRGMGKSSLDLASQIAAATDIKVNPVERFDINTVTGINNVIEEKDINAVVMGMHRKASIVDTFLGQKIEQLLGTTRRMIVLSRFFAPVNTISRIIIYAPLNAQYEAGFRRWVMTVGNLGQELGCKVIFCCPSDMQPAIRSVLRSENYPIRVEFKDVNERDDFLLLANRILDEDLFIWITARPGSVSWSQEQGELPSFISRYLSRNNLLIIYPEISGDGLKVQTFADPLAVDFSVTAVPIWSRARQWVYKIKSRLQKNTRTLPFDLD